MNQGTIDIALHGVGRALIVGMRIEPKNIACGGIAESFGICHAGERKQRYRGSRSQQSQTKTHDSLPVV